MEQRDPILKGFPYLQVKKSQIKKQLQRVSDFSRFLPLKDQQNELNALVKKLDAEIAFLNRCLELFASTKLLTEVGEKLLMQSAQSLDASQ
jgi:hypothetical protein